MTSWRMLRLSGLPAVVPILFGLGVWVALSNTGDSANGYSVNNLSVASSQLIVTGPLLASWSAFRFPPLLALIRGARPVRSVAGVLAAAGLPLLLGGPAAGVLAMLSATRVFPWGWVDWQVIGVSYICGVACGAFGALLGVSLPRLLAIPVAAASTFAWLAIPGARLSVLPRNLNSAFVACCSDRQEPALGMVLGSSTLNFALIVGALLTVWWVTSRRYGRLPGFASLLVVVAMAGALGGLTAKAGQVPGSGVSPVILRRG